MRFSLGVNYWPARSAMAMWRRFDPGEIGEDFGRMANLGLDTVRFFLRWDDFAPAPNVVDATMLERLATVLMLAADAGLQTLPVLFCGHIAGVNFLPDWALDRTRRSGRFRTISGKRELPYGAGNLYRGPLLEAQCRFAAIVSERFAQHPAIQAWDIGNAFSCVREPRRGKAATGEHSPEPVSEREVAEWSRRLTGALHTHSPLPVTAGTTNTDVTEDRDIRLGSLCLPFAFASMQDVSLTDAFARNRLDAETLPFLAMLTAAFSFKDVLCTSFGNPTCPPDKFSAFERFALPNEMPNATISPEDTAFATFPCLTEHENAVYARAVLERLHADGRLGAYWHAWTDYGDTLSHEPPFDGEPHERHYGLIRSDGTERPVAAVLRAFASERREVVPAREMPTIASNYYYRTLPKSTQTLYDGFLRFVAPRRAAAVG